MGEIDKNEIQALFRACDFDNENSYRLFCEQLQELSGASFWEGEAKKAFGERDAAKHKVKGLTSLMDKKIEETKRNLRRSVTDNKLLQYEVVKHAKGCKAYNPDQIYKLLKDEFQQAEDGTFYVPLMNDQGAEVSRKSVADAVKEFLNDETNDNLVEAGVRGGSGHFQVTYSQNKRQGLDRHGKPTKSRKKYDPEFSKQASDHGFNAETWAEIQKEKQEIIAKRKGK